MLLLLLATLLLQGTPAAPQPGVITGRISFADGAGVAGVTVIAVPAPPAEAYLPRLPRARTDASGRYRLEGIAAGTYTLTTEIKPGGMTFYPGGVPQDPSASVSIAVVSVTNGATVEIGNFTTREPGFKVSGRLVVAPALPVSGPIPVQLSGGAGGGQVVESVIRPDRTFEFPRVTAGTYVLGSMAGVPTTRVVVADRDVSGVELGAVPGFRVTGRIAPSSPGSPIPPTQIFLRVRVDRTGPLVGAQVLDLLNPLNRTPDGTQRGDEPRGTGGAMVNADGTFEFLRVPPGTYVVQMIPAKQGEQVLPDISNRRDLPVIVVDKEDLTGVQLPLQTR
jgi:hypothetical protein